MDGVAQKEGEAILLVDDRQEHAVEVSFVGPGGRAFC
jgi:hypothetical protein